MTTWQIILAIIIVGLSIIMPIYYSNQRKKRPNKKKKQLNVCKSENTEEKLTTKLEININEKTFRDRGSGFAFMTLRRLFKELIIRSCEIMNQLLDLELKKLFSFKTILVLSILCFCLWFLYHLFS